MKYRRKLKVEELNRISIEEFQDAKKIPLIVVLDNVRSQNNIGSVFRTSDAFRVEGFSCAELPPCHPMWKFIKPLSVRKIR